jgi:acetylglutamate kinase
MGDILLLSLIGIKVVLVHGGGPEISEMLGKVGAKTEFIDGLRVTDKESIDIVQMVLAGKVNKNLVNLIHTMGGKAIGLCGIDGHMISASRHYEVHGYVGDVSDIDPTPILDVLDKGYIPVIATVGCDDDGNVYNINADTAAAKIAGVLKATSLISMTDIRGLLRDKDDESTLIPLVKTSEVPELVAEGIISGGMIPKIDCCIESIRQGVDRVFILDGRVPHAILIEILTDEGIGTMVV